MRKRQWLSPLTFSVTKNLKGIPFENFYEDMGPKPTPAHSIDRFPNNNGNYEPGNCRWATRTEQSGSRRSNVILVINGHARTVVEWGRISGVSPSTIYARLGRGWTHEQAAFGPTKAKK